MSTVAYGQRWRDPKTGLVWEVVSVRSPHVMVRRSIDKGRRLNSVIALEELRRWTLQGEPAN
jgi:hypothetical protein